MIARIVTWGFTAALVLASASAHADKRAAAQHFERGRALFADGSFAAALDEFEAGYATFPLPGFLVNIGQCQRKLGRLDEASGSFEKFLDSNAGDRTLRGQVQEALDELKVERQLRERERSDAQAEARRAREEAERAAAQTRAQAEPRSRALTPTASAPSTSPLAAAAEQDDDETPAPPPRKRRRWVWALVGALAAGAAAAAVAVAVVETQPSSTPHAGSLGLVDARR